jgi:hypothetical protein
MPDEHQHDDATAGDALQAAEARVRVIRAGWPRLLAVALTTHGRYAAQIAGVGLVRFTGAAESSEAWVRLRLAGTAPGDWQAFGTADELEVRAELIQSVFEEPAD